MLAEASGKGKVLGYDMIDKAPEEKARGITIATAHVEYETTSVQSLSRLFFFVGGDDRAEVRVCERSMIKWPSLIGEMAADEPLDAGIAGTATTLTSTARATPITYVSFPPLPRPLI